MASRFNQVDPACQVDFYIVEDESKSVEQLACQLAMMAWERGMSSLLLMPSTDQAEQLDRMMWAVPQERFLPHQLCDQATQAPVTIGTASHLLDTPAEVIINLTTELVPTPQRFKRLLELVPARDEERKASRSKFRAYREQGLEPKSHVMGQSSGNN
jgi:DNA polymerase-3 subunit chi